MNCICVVSIGWKTVEHELIGDQPHQVMDEMRVIYHINLPKVIT